jgi:hypothetical protein
MKNKIEELKKKWLEYRAKGDVRGMKITEIRAKLIVPVKSKSK